MENSVPGASPASLVGAPHPVCTATPQLGPISRTPHGVPKCSCRAPGPRHPLTGSPRAWPLLHLAGRGPPELLTYYPPPCWSPATHLTSVARMRCWGSPHEESRSALHSPAGPRPPGPEDVEVECNASIPPSLMERFAPTLLFTLRSCRPGDFPIADERIEAHRNSHKLWNPAAGSSNLALRAGRRGPAGCRTCSRAGCRAHYDVR